MNTPQAKFIGSVPDHYDTYLGPLLFEFPAKDLAARLAERLPPDSTVLEIACGTGIATEHLRHALPPSVSIVATDASDMMLSIAQQKRADLQNVTYEVADACDLPFSDANFDAVAAQFGIMFFPDKLQGLGEMFRVMKPGGTLAFNVWDSSDEEHRRIFIVQDTVNTFLGDKPTNFIALPFSFSDIKEVTEMVKEAGYEEVTASTVSEVVERPDGMGIAKGFVRGTPIASDILAAEADFAAIEEAVAKTIEDEFGSPPKVPLQEIVFMARKPL